VIYDLIAPVYDEINEEIDYSAWADFIEKLVSLEYPKKPELVLDLGCGTGRMTVELAKRGYDMTGVDFSVEMLEVARERAEGAGLSREILWLFQDMSAFELYGTVDLTVSCLDCINHLTRVADVKKCFSLVHNYLSPDGLFIFDVNGRGKFERVYADRSYVMDTDVGMCVWQNFYNKKTHLCDFFITLFSDNGDGTYARYDEHDMERMLTLKSIKSYLTEAGFEFVGAYSDYNMTPATDDDERIYIVARCKKEGKGYEI